MTYIPRDILETNISNLQSEINEMSINILNLQTEKENYFNLFTETCEELNIFKQKSINSDIVRDFIYEFKNDESKSFNDIINLIESLPGALDS